MNDTKRKQPTRGHNIVADGWAGASNSQPHPNPTPNHSFHPLQPERDGAIDGPTDGQSLLQIRVSATKKLNIETKKREKKWAEWKKK